MTEDHKAAVEYPYIEFVHVCKSFDDLPVLIDVTFAVRRGEMVVVLGRSGVGKSVMLKNILGFLHPDEGQVLVEGRDISRLNEQDLAALDQFGIRCVIAPSYADIFYNNSLKNGVLPAIVPDADVSALLKQIQDFEDLQVRVDLKEQVVSTNHGLSFKFTVGEDAKSRLLSGLDDIGQTLLHEKDIAAFEQRRKQQMPWL